MADPPCSGPKNILTPQYNLGASPTTFGRNIFHNFYSEMAPQGSFPYDMSQNSYTLHINSADGRPTLQWPKKYSDPPVQPGGKPHKFWPKDITQFLFRHGATGVISILHVTEFIYMSH